MGTTTDPYGIVANSWTSLEDPPHPLLASEPFPHTLSIKATKEIDLGPR